MPGIASSDASTITQAVVDRLTPQGEPEEPVPSPRAIGGLEPPSAQAEATGPGARSAAAAAAASGAAIGESASARLGGAAGAADDGDTQGVPIIRCRTEATPARPVASAAIGAEVCGALLDTRDRFGQVTVVNECGAAAATGPVHMYIDVASVGAPPLSRESVARARMQQELVTVTLRSRVCDTAPDTLALLRVLAENPEALFSPLKDAIDRAVILRTRGQASAESRMPYVARLPAAGRPAAPSSDEAGSAAKRPRVEDYPVAAATLVRIETFPELGPTERLDPKSAKIPLFPGVVCTEDETIAVLEQPFPAGYFGSAGDERLWRRPDLWRMDSSRRNGGYCAFRTLRALGIPMEHVPWPALGTIVSTIVNSGYAAVLHSGGYAVCVGLPPSGDARSVILELQPGHIRSAKFGPSWPVRTVGLVPAGVLYSQFGMQGETLDAGVLGPSAPPTAPIPVATGWVPVTRATADGAEPGPIVAGMDSVAVGQALARWNLSDSRSMEFRPRVQATRTPDLVLGGRTGDLGKFLEMYEFTPRTVLELALAQRETAGGPLDVSVVGALLASARTALVNLAASPHAEYDRVHSAIRAGGAHARLSRGALRAAVGHADASNPVLNTEIVYAYLAVVAASLTPSVGTVAEPSRTNLKWNRERLRAVWTVVPEVTFHPPSGIDRGVACHFGESSADKMWFGFSFPDGSVVRVDRYLATNTPVFTAPSGTTGCQRQLASARFSGSREGLTEEVEITVYCESSVEGIASAKLRDYTEAVKGADSLVARASVFEVYACVGALVASTGEYDPFDERVTRLRAATSWAVFRETIPEASKHALPDHVDGPATGVLRAILSRYAAESREPRSLGWDRPAKFFVEKKMERLDVRLIISVGKLALSHAGVDRTPLERAVFDPIAQRFWEFETHDYAPGHGGQRAKTPSPVTSLPRVAPSDEGRSGLRVATEPAARSAPRPARHVTLTVPGGATEASSMGAVHTGTASGRGVAATCATVGIGSGFGSGVASLFEELEHGYMTLEELDRAAGRLQVRIRAERQHPTATATGRLRLNPRVPANHVVMTSLLRLAETDPTIYGPASTFAELFLPSESGLASLQAELTAPERDRSARVPAAAAARPEPAATGRGQAAASSELRIAGPSRSRGPPRRSRSGRQGRTAAQHGWPRHGSGHVLADSTPTWSKLQDLDAALAECNLSVKRSTGADNCLRDVLGEYHVGGSAAVTLGGFLRGEGLRPGTGVAVERMAVVISGGDVRLYRGPPGDPRTDRVVLVVRDTGDASHAMAFLTLKPHTRLLPTTKPALLPAALANRVLTGLRGKSSPPGPPPSPVKGAARAEGPELAEWRLWEAARGPARGLAAGGRGEPGWCARDALAPHGLVPRIPFPLASYLQRLAARANLGLQISFDSAAAGIVGVRPGIYNYGSPPGAAYAVEIHTTIGHRAFGRPILHATHALVIEGEEAAGWTDGRSAAAPRESPIGADRPILGVARPLGGRPRPWPPEAALVLQFVPPRSTELPPPAPSPSAVPEAGKCLSTVLAGINREVDFPADPTLALVADRWPHIEGLVFLLDGSAAALLGEHSGMHRVIDGGARDIIVSVTAGRTVSGAPGLHALSAASTRASDFARDGITGRHGQWTVGRTDLATCDSMAGSDRGMCATSALHRSGYAVRPARFPTLRTLGADPALAGLRVVFDSASALRAGVAPHVEYEIARGNHPVTLRLEDGTGRDGHWAPHATEAAPSTGQFAATLPTAALQLEVGQLGPGSMAAVLFAFVVAGIGAAAAPASSAPSPTAAPATAAPPVAPRRRGRPPEHTPTPIAHDRREPALTVNYSVSLTGHYPRPLISDCSKGSVPLDSTNLEKARLVTKPGRKAAMCVRRRVHALRSPPARVSRHVRSTGRPVWSDRPSVRVNSTNSTPRHRTAEATEDPTIATRTGGCLLNGTRAREAEIEIHYWCPRPTTLTLGPASQSTRFAFALNPGSDVVVAPTECRNVAWVARTDGFTWAIPHTLCGCSSLAALREMAGGSWICATHLGPMISSIFWWIVALSIGAALAACIASRIRGAGKSQTALLPLILCLVVCASAGVTDAMDGVGSMPATVWDMTPAYIREADGSVQQIIQYSAILPPSNIVQLNIGAIPCTILTEIDAVLDVRDFTYVISPDPSCAGVYQPYEQILETGRLTVSEDDAGGDGSMADKVVGRAIAFTRRHYDLLDWAQQDAVLRMLVKRANPVWSAERCDFSITRMSPAVLTMWETLIFHIPYVGGFLVPRSEWDYDVLWWCAITDARPQRPLALDLGMKGIRGINLTIGCEGLGSVTEYMPPFSGQTLWMQGGASKVREYLRQLNATLWLSTVGGVSISGWHREARHSWVDGACVAATAYLAIPGDPYGPYPGTELPGLAYKELPQETTAELPWNGMRVSSPFFPPTGGMAMASTARVGFLARSERAGQPAIEDPHAQVRLAISTTAIVSSSAPSTYHCRPPNAQLKGTIEYGVSLVLDTWDCTALDSTGKTVACANPTIFAFSCGDLATTVSLKSCVETALVVQLGTSGSSEWEGGKYAGPQLCAVTTDGVVHVEGMSADNRLYVATNNVNSTGNGGAATGGTDLPGDNTTHTTLLGDALASLWDWLTVDGSHHFILLVAGILGAIAAALVLGGIAYLLVVCCLPMCTTCVSARFARGFTGGGALPMVHSVSIPVTTEVQPRFHVPTSAGPNVVVLTGPRSGMRSKWSVST